MHSIASTPRFRQLLFNAVIVPVALMAIIAGLLVWQIERLERASALVEHSDRVIAQANELQKLTLDLETGLRGYLLTDELLFLEPYNKAITRVDPLSHSLESLVQDNPQQQSLVNQINSFRADWFNYGHDQMQRRQQRLDYSSPERLGAGKKMMDAIRESFRSFISNEETLRDQRSISARHVSQVTLILTGVMAVVVGGILAFLSRSQFLVITNTYDEALKVSHDANITLENRVAERTAELQQQSTKLSEVNSELEAFAYSISHDLRAPMRHISGFIELVRKSGMHFDAEIDGLLTTIADTARLAGKMVDDLLSFSRVGRAPLNRVRVELNPILEQSCRELAPDIVGREVVWSIAPLPAVHGDPALIRMVLQNVLANAVKYTGKTASALIEVGTDSQTGPVDEKANKPTQKMVTFFVRDNGTGFDMEYAQKLFGVFQRLHRAEEFEGTGIGLANVRRIILRHGGRVWAKGELGKGATFYFTLPLAE